MTTLTRVTLWLAAALFLAFGLAILIQPELLSGMGLPVQPVWRTELRAFYGGLEIGLAAFLILCARRPAWALPGLVAAAQRGIGLDKHVHADDGLDACRQRRAVKGVDL